MSDRSKFLSYTSPARARKLLKEGKATVFNTEPFSIKLKEGGRVMRAVTNFTEYFKGEERDVYVKNVSNNQVSLQFEVAAGRFEFVLIPKTRDPFNITQYVPFDAVKRSTDIRKLVNRNPPALQLMTFEEYEEYYNKLAAQKKTTKDEEIMRALELQTALMNRTAYVESSTKQVKSIDDLRTERVEDGVDEQPHPRVVGMCSQVGVDVDQKISAAEMLNELESLLLEGLLKPSDLEYVSSRGYYKTVKKWADKALGVLTSETEDDTKEKISE